MRSQYLALAAILFCSVAHAQQGNLPRPVQKLPAYPPVVCVTPDWTQESCQTRKDSAIWQCGNVRVAWSGDLLTTMEYLLTGIEQRTNRCKMEKDELYLNGKRCTAFREHKKTESFEPQTALPTHPAPSALPSRSGRPWRPRPEATIEAVGDTIKIKGYIKRGMFDKFTTTLMAHPDTKTISISSPGGDAYEAIRIGTIIREMKYATFVPTVNYCASACVFIWAAGVPRELAIGAKLYLHCVHDPQTLECDEGASASIMNYLSQLGMPREAIVPLMTTKATDAVQLRADMEGLVTTKDTRTAAH
jgi:ATP-dependent protease ClpP protease subunit